ncbi:MAG: hypothetical protein ACEY3D_01325 [Rickettsia sp.]
MPRRFAPRNDGFGIYAIIPSRVGLVAWIPMSFPRRRESSNL